MAWTQAGLYAWTTVWTITYGGPKGFDPFGGFLFRDQNPHGARMGFDAAIINHVYQNAHKDKGNPAWFTCTYCQWEYPRERCHIDHRIPWADYSLAMTNSRPLSAALALQVWVGCNDPSNLVVACDKCNTAKGNRPATPAWIGQRKAMANRNQGF